MAPKAPTTPKAKPAKAAKGGITKRTPTKVSPVKATANKAAPGAPLDKDLLFLWKCVQMSTGMKIDWTLVSNDTGKPFGILQKQYWRLNTKIEKYIAATSPADAPADASDVDNDTSEKCIQTTESNEAE
ncbi:hypothetical protein N7463_004633 [Penicillium fimorum]|uniref:Myb-like DNA-binding domain-containing protein n=1 Tax=Penicillium fimorum TaxID=1882269 RepID=A0A9W9Y3D8_9EURO|nr:hypothetical protein N7463_004633 [Penicillium fimorum]